MHIQEALMIATSTQRDLINLYQSMKTEFQRFGIFLSINLFSLDIQENKTVEVLAVLLWMMTQSLLAGEMDLSDVLIEILKQ